MLKILHTSDVQLDAPFRFLGDKGKEHRRRLRKAFQRIVDLAIHDDCHLLLIAGDLFNDNRPSQTTVDFVARHLGRLDIPVCILPGNHDCYDSKSVYRRAQFPDNVFILTERPTILEFPEIDATIYGNATLSRQSRLGPLQGLTRDGSRSWHIALAHGSIVRPDIEDPPLPIHPHEISACGMDYVALGDWHTFADYTEGNVKACYSGAPEPTELDQTGAGSVAYIQMDDNGVRVSRKRIGVLSCDELSIDVSGKTVAQVIEEIKALADPNLMLKVTLYGFSELGTVLDVERLKEAVTSDFYFVDISDQTHPEIEHISADEFPENLVVGKFVRLMQERIQRATDEQQRRQVEQALQLGMALLQGKEVL